MKNWTYKEFGDGTPTKEQWLRLTESMERDARRHGFFELSSMLQDLRRVLSDETTTRRDFHNVVGRRSFREHTCSVKILDKLLREEKEQRRRNAAV